MKEVGGYFELELPKKNEYHFSAVKLNSARNAFKYILMAQSIRKVYIPAYICDSMIQPLIDLKINYEFYNINSDFEIDNAPLLRTGEKILYVNYFSLKGDYIKNLSVAYGESLIIDGSQAFYEKPLKNIDTIYSPRKFFGVSDGGYLYTRHRLDWNLKQDNSEDFAKHLVGRLLKGAKEYYKDFQMSELNLSSQPVKVMSNITRRILTSIDYESVSRKRVGNFNFLLDALKDLNTLPLSQVDNTPFAYPLLTSDLKLRQKLIENGIYVPSYWREVAFRDNASEVEKDFSERLLLIPIDQRYDASDMQDVVSIIKENINA